MHSKANSDERFDEIAQESGSTPVSPKTPIFRPDLDAPIKPHGMSRREIARMRTAGIQKPHFITWGDWFGPQRLNHRSLLVCYLAAQGHKAKEIARMAGMSANRISVLINSEICQIQVQLIREVEFGGLGTEQQVDQLAPQAARIAQDIMTSETTSPKEKWQVARDILDRKLGKAKQRIEHSGSLVADLYQVMSEHIQQAVPPTIEVTSVEAQSEPASLPAVIEPEPARKPACEPSDEILEKLKEAGF